jgi:glc operon protein GlcG
MTRLLRPLVCAAVLACAAPALAQTAAAPAPAAPPAAPVVRPPYGATITLAQAKAAVAAAEAEARANGWQVVITIVEPNGAVVMSEKMDGTQYGSIDVSRGKATTAALFRRPSREFVPAMATGNASVLALGVVPIEGGELILVDGKIVGAIGVSGATSAQDGQMARAGAAAVH